MRYGRCTNFDGPCPKYESGDLIEVPDGADFVCPECEYDLMEVASEGGGSRTTSYAIGGGVLIVLLSVGAWVLMQAPGPVEVTARASADTVESVPASAGAAMAAAEQGRDAAPPNGIEVYFDRVNGYLNALVDPDISSQEADAVIQEALALFADEDAAVRVVQNGVAVERIGIRDFLRRQKLLRRDVAATRHIQINPQGKITEIEITETGVR